jgi:hypothetical protein
MIASSADGLPIWFWIALSLAGVAGVVKNAVALHRARNESVRSRQRYGMRIVATSVVVVTIVVRMFILKG